MTPLSTAFSDIRERGAYTIWLAVGRSVDDEDMRELWEKSIQKSLWLRVYDAILSMQRSAFEKVLERYNIESAHDRDIRDAISSVMRALGMEKRL